jgi:hypothetical protein
VTFFLLGNSATSPENQVLERTVSFDTAKDVEDTVVLLIFSIESSHASLTHVASNLGVRATDDLFYFNGSVRSSYDYNEVRGTRLVKLFFTFRDDLSAEVVTTSNSFFIFTKLFFSGVDGADTYEL